MKRNSNGGPLVTYLTRWVGDYHAPRLRQLNRSCAEEGWRFIVAQFGEKSSFYTHAQIRRNRLIRDFNFRPNTGIWSWRVVGRVWSFLLLEKPDHIVVLGYNDLISVSALVFSRVFGSRIYFCSDSKLDDQPRSHLKERIKSLIVRCFDGALVAGRRHEKYFRSIGFKGVVEIPYDVVDNDYFSKRSVKYWRRFEKGLKSLLGEKYVVCVSRLVQRKNVPLAIDVFFCSRLAGDGWKFVLVGSGPDEQKIYDHVCKLGLMEDFVHLPQVPNHRMPAVLGGALALILASEYDQWGLCVNEAMACGVPVCVTERCGCAHELVNENTGFIFTPEKVSEAGNWLNSLTSDAVRREVSMACLAQVEKFSLERFSAAVVALVKSSDDPR